MTLSNLVNLSEYDMKFLCTVNETSQNIKKILSNLTGSVRMLFVIGPEGGFTKEEEQKLIENGFIMTVPSGAMHSRVDYKLQNLNKNKVLFYIILFLFNHNFIYL